MKRIIMKITPTGQIDARTSGIKGTACLSYVRILEQLTDAVSVDSAFTKEYLETECQKIAEQEEETVCSM